MATFAFEKLDLYNLARNYRTRLYKLSKLLPPDEYKLKIQIRDAARSITNCIAEGHGRYTYKDRKRLLHIARGSLEETVDDINLCIDEEYAKREHLENLRDDAETVLKMLNAYIRYLRKRDNETKDDTTTEE